MLPPFYVVMISCHGYFSPQLFCVAAIFRCSILCSDCSRPCSPLPDTLSDIELQFKNAQTNHEHQCGAGSGRPLRHELGRLSEQVQKVLEDMRGVPLEKVEEREV